MTSSIAPSGHDMSDIAPPIEIEVNRGDLVESRHRAAFAGRMPGKLHSRGGPGRAQKREHH